MAGKTPSLRGTFAHTMGIVYTLTYGLQYRSCVARTASNSRATRLYNRSISQLLLDMLLAYYYRRRTLPVRVVARLTSWATGATTIRKVSAVRVVAANMCERRITNVLKSTAKLGHVRSNPKSGDHVPLYARTLIVHVPPENPAVRGERMQQPSL